MADYKAPVPQKRPPMIMHWFIPAGVIVGAIIAQGGLHF